MYAMQATFTAKPGKAQGLADKLVAAARKTSDDRIKRWGVLIDHVVVEFRPEGYESMYSLRPERGPFGE